MQYKLGFIGLGKLGHAICQRMIHHSSTVVVYNRTQQKAYDLIERGAILATDIASLVTVAEILFICVSGDDALHAVYYAEKGILKNPGNVKVIVELSTIAPENAVALHAELYTLGIDYVDCPVSGGIEGAELGTLSSITSATPEILEKLEPLLRRFCNTITVVKGPGTAQKLKILNNLAESINLAGALEVIHQGIASGIDIRSMVEVFTSCRGKSAYMNVALSYVTSGYSTSNVSLATRCKDLGLALQQFPPAIRHPVTSATLAAFQRTRDIYGEAEDQCRYFSLVSTHDGE